MTEIDFINFYGELKKAQQSVEQASDALHSGNVMLATTYINQAKEKLTNTLDPEVYREEWMRP